MNAKSARPNDALAESAVELLMGATLPAHSLDTLGGASISGSALQNAVRLKWVIGLTIDEILKATDWKPDCET